MKSAVTDMKRISATRWSIEAAAMSHSPYEPKYIRIVLLAFSATSLADIELLTKVEFLQLMLFPKVA